MSIWPGEKLIEKMWETLTEKGVASLLKPGQIVREGKALTEVRRNEMLALAQAEADAAEIKAGRKRLQRDGTLLTLSHAADQNFLLLPGPDGRVEPTFDMQSLLLNMTAKSAAEQLQSEINVARTVMLAEEILGQYNQSPNDEVLDDDWLSTWNAYAGKVSNEELQRLWANILAGEVKQPGTFSRRTLEFLRTLAKRDAELISKLASFVINNKFISREMDEVLKINGIDTNLLLEMQELGVLTGIEALGLSLTYNSLDPENYICAFRSYGKLVILKRPGKHQIVTQVYLLTNLGKEVMKLGQFAPNIEYLTAFAKHYASMGFQAEVADYWGENENQIVYGNVTHIAA